VNYPSKGANPGNVVVNMAKVALATSILGLSNSKKEMVYIKSYEDLLIRMLCFSSATLLNGLCQIVRS
jgi:hypothetical protein